MHLGGISFYSQAENFANSRKQHKLSNTCPTMHKHWFLKLAKTTKDTPHPTKIIISLELFSLILSSALHYPSSFISLGLILQLCKVSSVSNYLLRRSCVYKTLHFKTKYIQLSPLKQTRVILLHAQPQVLYCNCVKFHQYLFAVVE